MAKTSAVVTPNVLARTLTTTLKRTITPKMVRSAARDRIKRFDKVSHPEYQGHAYDAAEVKALTALFASRTGRSVAQTVTRVTTKPAKVTAKARASRKPAAPAAKPDAS